jgi:hypothetical protein
MAAALLLTCVTANAGELSVRAPVVNVEPITESARNIEHCDPKPSGASLGETLAWDLGLGCRTERVASSRVTGYRVFYRWDDRVYSQVMSREPGDSIPLTVRLD